jgi:hypothetical protein
MLVQRFVRQRLIGEPFADPVAAVGWFGGVQSQDFVGALWGVGQRCQDVTEADLRRLFDEGAILRTHVLRPTWHFVAPADLRWLLALTAPRVHMTNGPYYRRHGLDEQALQRAADVVTAALIGRQLTRAELASELAQAGIDTEGLRLGLIVMWCELEALICSGAMRGKQHTYALVQERVAPAPVRDPQEALGELARRYFASHGPATVQDFAWWSGLKVKDAFRAVDIGRPTRNVPDEDAVLERRAHLLSNYDEYIVAYRDRSSIPALEDNLKVPLGSNLVLVDGKMAGVWKRTIKARQVNVTIGMLPNHRSADEEIAAQGERYGRFLGLPVDLKTVVFD